MGFHNQSLINWNHPTSSVFFFPIQTSFFWLTHMYQSCLYWYCHYSVPKPSRESMKIWLWLKNMYKKKLYITYVNLDTKRNVTSWCQVCCFAGEFILLCESGESAKVVTGSFISLQVLTLVPVFCILHHCGEYWAVVNTHRAQ